MNALAVAHEIAARLPGDLTLAVKGNWIAIATPRPHILAVGPLSREAYDLAAGVLMAGVSIAVLHDEGDLEAALDSWGLA